MIAHVALRARDRAARSLLASVPRRELRRRFERALQAASRIPDADPSCRSFPTHPHASSAEAGLWLTGDREIRDLNRSWRALDRPTDVLSFSQREGEGAANAGPLLGDVVISIETAARQARQRSVSLLDEVTTLLIHGLIHCKGYDHERSAREARRMRQLERLVLGFVVRSDTLA